MTESPSDIKALFVAVDVHYLHDSAARAAIVAAGQVHASPQLRGVTAVTSAYLVSKCQIESDRSGCSSLR
jgi:hypothetical protein